MIVPMTNVMSYRGDINALKCGAMCYPRFADLHTSNHCNQHCEGCAYADWLDNTMMSEKDHIEVIRQLVDIGVRAFDFAGGGEPLTLTYLPRIWEILNGRGLHWSLITNGTLLTDELVKPIVDHATYVRVSLEASNEWDYTQYKRVGVESWEQVLANVLKLTQAKRDRGGHCEIAIKFSVGKSLRGADHFRDGIALGHMLGVDNVQFKALRHEPEELLLEGKKREAQLFRIASQDEEPGFVRSWIMPNPNVPQCYLNPLHTVVDHRGDVYLCCYYYCRECVENHRLGNMLETPLALLWGTPEHKEKIENISREECAKVDCKFFRHHQVVEEHFKRGRYYWL